MSRVTNWLFDTKHPLLFALVCLAIAVANIYEATHNGNPNGLMYVVSWICAAGGLIGFVAFLFVAVSEYLSRGNGGQ
jgi:protein-S-isoprenylcysteine O-methyltransferase Ste14